MGTQANVLLEKDLRVKFELDLDQQATRNDLRHWAWINHI